MTVQKILHATDFSPHSAEVLRYATWLARQMVAKLLIVHVSDAEPLPVGELFDEHPDPDPKARARLQSVVPDESGVVYEHRLLFGKVGSLEQTKPDRVLVEFAQCEKVDMIVIGSHGHGGLHRLLMGSVAESVIRNAPCPVITVHLANAAQAVTAESVGEKTGYSHE